MSALSESRRTLERGYTSIGKRGLNALYPNDIEIYVFAFELLDYNLNTLDYFLFPIAPSEMYETHIKNTNVQKTFAGVVSLRDSTFIPTHIRIAGDFGRALKILISLRSQGVDFTRYEDRGDDKGSYQNKREFLSGTAKTGYGCVKILESIFKRATYTDNGNPRILAFYNFASGNNYIVEQNTLMLSQTEDKRQIPQYSLNMTSIAELESVFPKSNERLLATNILDGLQNLSNSIYRTGRSFLNEVTR